jgi:NO-binding membrane sensor protein with MHYT domain
MSRPVGVGLLIRDGDRMYFVFNCMVTEHDFRLVGLAAVICALASFTAISLLHHVRRSGAHMRRVCGLNTKRG